MMKYMILKRPNGQGFAQFDILQMKENENAKWQIVTNVPRVVLVGDNQQDNINRAY